jgi:hypothetical protein
VTNKELVVEIKKREEDIKLANMLYALFEEQYIEITDDDMHKLYYKTLISVK